MLEQRNNYRSNLTSYKATIISLYEQLSSKIDAWDNLYVIRAPANGIVDFSLIWSKNQYVQAGDKSFAIIPHQTGDTIGKCLYSVSGIGKIKTGQPVTIKLDGYPYLEYGVLRGNVRSISSIPIEVQTQNGIEKFISIEVDLCANFNASYHYTIPYAGELTGTSEIIIENRSLLQHFFNPLKYLWNNNIADRK